jgi:uncharacterized SAM-binding protein YcdF (DUF218 family)
MSIYAILGYLAQPVVLVYLALGCAIARAWFAQPRPRRGLRAIAFFYLLIPVLSLPVTEHFVLGSLERQNPPAHESLTGADAIVVLSGDVLQPAEMRPKAEPGPSTIYRCLHAAELYHAKARPMIVTGATSDPEAAEIGCAPVMRELLIKLGVRAEDIIVENNSFSTYENAVACRSILAAQGYRKVILVTEAGHLPRAVRCFQSQGIEVIPSGCRYRSCALTPELVISPPNLDAAKMMQGACHEWLGIFWYWLRGRI